MEPVALTIFPHDLNSMGISPWCNFVAGFQIATIFAHDMTAPMSCHIQNFVAISVLELRWELNKISFEFELRWKHP